MPTRNILKDFGSGLNHYIQDLGRDPFGARLYDSMQQAVTPEIFANRDQIVAAQDNPFGGIDISDIFGDEIRLIQQQAAERQMEYQTNSAERAMQFSADEAKKARDWSEYMSSTQFSRAVKDLENAGLNPVLAAGGGFSPGSFSSSTSATGIAQTGSQAQVSEYNSGLSALEVYLEFAASIFNSVSDKLFKGKSFKIGFGD